jgi:molybdopterin-guanine dinucleotide biosynthesis protein
MNAMEAKVWQRRRDSGAVSFTEDEKYAIDGAKKWLHLALTRQETREYYIEYMREGLEIAQVTIKYLSLTEDKIAQLLIEGHRYMAFMWLNLARTRAENREPYIKHFREELAVIRKLAKVRVVRFAEFNTSKEELERLLIEGFRHEARRKLELARTRENCKRSFTEDFLEFAAKAKTPLSEFGSNFEEVNRLVQG